MGFFNKISTKEIRRANNKQCPKRRFSKAPTNYMETFYKLVKQLRALMLAMSRGIFCFFFCFFASNWHWLLDFVSQVYCNHSIIHGPIQQRYELWNCLLHITDNGLFDYVFWITRMINLFTWRRSSCRSDRNSNGLKCLHEASRKLINRSQLETEVRRPEIRILLICRLYIKSALSALHIVYRNIIMIIITKINMQLNKLKTNIITKIK
jgi:hypothetical protein